MIFIKTKKNIKNEELLNYLLFNSKNFQNNLNFAIFFLFFPAKK